MTPTFRTNSRPMDHIAGLAPMHPHDEAFARRKEAANDNRRVIVRGALRQWPLFLLLVAMACLAPFVACVWPN